jgi:Xaa-Pro aminopeptidase
LDRLMTAEEPAYEAFAALKAELGLLADRIGFEQAEAFEPAAYAPNLFRGSAARILRRAFPSGALAPADDLLAELRARKTSAEIEHIRTVCRIVEHAFRCGFEQFHPGASEPEVATLFRTALSACAVNYKAVKRCDGFTYCMSGPYAGRAWGPYSRSRNRIVDRGDAVVLRCHAYADGYWADVARTYFVGEPAPVQRRMFDAVLAARAAVLDKIRPGVRGAELDATARSEIEAHGFGEFIKHATGYGAGFGTLDHTARPRLHPKSEDVIEDGMVLKLELGVYCGDIGGVRMSDIIALADGRADLLTTFHASFKDLTFIKN